MKDLEFLGKLIEALVLLTLCSVSYRTLWETRAYGGLELSWKILDVDEVDGEETRLLVKWLGAPYSESTYEMVKDLESAGQVITDLIKGNWLA